MVETTPMWLKRAVRAAGLLLAVPGLVIAINLFCIVPLVLLSSSGADAVTFGVVSLTFTLLTLGAGGAAFWHAHQALNKKPSNPLRLPSPLLFAGVFIILIELGVISRMSLEIFFPLILVLCALLPPVWAVAWITSSQTVFEDSPPIQPFMTWRRGLLSFAGGATISTLLALVLAVLLPLIVFSLIPDLADSTFDDIRTVARALSSAELASVFRNRGFIFLFIQIAVIAPLVDEIAKPLITLPVLRNLDRQQAFWIGAMAGAGFAAVENIVYAAGSLSLWAGILVVSALGSAIHPLGSGIMAVGWRDLLRGERDAAANWWRRLGIAVAVHAVWNGASLLVITWGGARFFGEVPAEVDVLVLSTGGAIVAFLIILGLAALWISRVYGQQAALTGFETEERSDTQSLSADRVVAIWALACIMGIVPAGIAGMMLWLR